MGKNAKLRKATVELQAEQRPSRIRREPATPGPIERMSNNAWWTSREWEIRLALIGIILFALGINAFVFDFGEFLSKY